MAVSPQSYLLSFAIRSSQRSPASSAISRFTKPDKVSTGGPASLSVKHIRGVGFFIAGEEGYEKRNQSGAVVFLGCGDRVRDDLWGWVLVSARA